MIYNFILRYYFFISTNSFSKYSIVSTSITQNSTVSMVVVGLSSKNLLTSFTRICAHLSFGKPNIPELIAGIEILLKHFSDASTILLLTVFLNLLFSSPSPILGPTACITALHGRLPAVVIAGETNLNKTYLIAFLLY